MDDLSGQDDLNSVQVVVAQAQAVIQANYWAAKPREDLGAEIKRKVEDYAQYLEASGLAPELRKSYYNFYGATSIHSVGDQGELQKIHVNQYASLVRAILNFITSNRPAFIPHSTNSDSQSQSQTILATGLLDYYLREKRLERSFREATQLALFLREGWMSLQWEADTGETFAINPDTKQPIKDGDVKIATHKLFDVIRETAKRDSRSFSWLILREYINKYDLAAKFPEHADRIISIQNKEEIEGRLRRDYLSKTLTEADDIEIYTLFHAKTPAMPQGRFAQMVDGDLTLIDSPLPYRKIPVFKVTTEDLIETAFGHSQAFDLLPLQEAFDMVISTIITNQAAFGVQNVLIPEGANLSVSQITGGMNALGFNPKAGEPKALNLTQTPAEIFNFATVLERLQETLSGVGATARGNPPSANMSGAAMALLQSTAIQYSSGLQQSYTALVEDCATTLLHILQDYAVTPRIAAITGKHNRPMLTEFKNSDIDQISRVTVDSGNALMNTTSGRITVADSLLQKGMIQRPEQYLMLIQTGQLEPLYENETSELLLIRRENEDLADGKQAIAIITDQHDVHVLEHKSVLASPEARNNPALVQAVTAHMQQHLNFLETASPQLLQLMKQNPIAPPQQPQQPQTPQPQISQVLNPQNPIEAQGQEVKGPQMPINPLTHQRYDPQNPSGK